MTVLESYEQAKGTTSDVNEHLPILRDYALQCNHVTEFGVRNVCSTWAFLDAMKANSGTLISYDVNVNIHIVNAMKAATLEGIDWTFLQKNTAEGQIEPTELLFIDTWHTAFQLAQELKLHASQVSKWILMHDTTTYAEVGEGQTDQQSGLKYAIEPFLKEHPEWQVKQVFTNNNGLTILERCTPQ